MMNLRVVVEDLEDERRQSLVARVRSRALGRRVECAVQTPDERRARTAAAALIATGLQVAEELDADADVRALVDEMRALQTAA